MLEFHAGSFKCAEKTKCPVMPIALIDAYKPFDHKGSRQVEVQIHYLRPVFYEEYQGLSTAQLAELVRSRITETIGSFGKKICFFNISETFLKTFKNISGI